MLKMRPESSKDAGLLIAADEPVVYVPVALVPEKTVPWIQVSIVVVPPARSTVPSSTPTAVGTLLNWTFESTIEPSRELEVDERCRKTGVSLITASMIASDPTDCGPAWVVAPIVISNPTWAELIVSPWKVHPLANDD